jgi:uncharacterized protein (DUF2267 family)
MNVSGIDGVISHLHAGLIEGDTRPSKGRAGIALPSHALESLLDAATAAGASAPRQAVHAVLCRFLERIPEPEREHVIGHLPADVKNLVGPRRTGATAVPAKIKKFDDLVAAVREDDAIAPQFADGLTRRVLNTLRSLVEDEVSDVAAVLPPELRDVWLDASPV